MSTNRPVTRSLAVMGIAVAMSLSLWGTVSGAKLIAAQRKPENAARQTLTGLSGVNVEVSGVTPDVGKGGLTAEILHTDVETPLRKAGIRILGQGEVLSTSGVPRLTLTLTTQKDEVGLTYVFGIELALVQDVGLVRDTKIVARAATWSIGAVALVGAGDLEDVRPIVWKQVDHFVAEYQAANQKR